VGNESLINVNSSLEEQPGDGDADFYRRQLTQFTKLGPFMRARVPKYWKHITSFLILTGSPADAKTSRGALVSFVGESLLQYNIMYNKILLYTDVYNIYNLFTLTFTTTVAETNQDRSQWIVINETIHVCVRYYLNALSYYYYT